MRIRGIGRIDGWVLKTTIACLLILSFTANLGMLFRTHFSQANFQSEKSEFRSTIDRITYESAEAFEIFTHGLSRVHLLDSLLKCALDNLETSSKVARSSMNVTGSSNIAPAPTLHIDTLKKMNEKMLKQLKLKESAMALLTEPLLYSHEFTYSHNPSTVCSDKNDTEILFVVPSAPDNFKNRERVRSGDRGIYIKNSANKAKLLFFVGLPEDNSKGREIQKNITKEAEKFGDIVQEDFVDNYLNITLKAVSMLKWASRFCYQAKFVFRTDDDIRVDVPKAVKALRRKEEELNNFILGQIRYGWTPIRNSDSKYYMSKDDFPPDVLPDFALGAMMAYPMSTVKLLYQAALRVRRLPMDDVYISAVCSAKLAVPLISDPDFNFEHRAW